MNNNIELKNIRSLSALNFFIPDYQRGYRWSETQVIKLLEDFKNAQTDINPIILSFYRNDGNNNNKSIFTYINNKHK